MSAVSFRTVSTIITVLLIAAFIGVIALVVDQTAETNTSAREVVADGPTAAPQPESTGTPSSENATALGQPEDAPPTDSTAQDADPSTDASLVETVAPDLLPARRVEAGNFEFQPLAGYSLTIDGSSVDLLAPDATASTGPQIVLNGQAPTGFSIDGTQGAEDSLEQFLNALSQDIGFTFEPIQPYTNSKIDGFTSEIGWEGDEPFVGRIFMAQPNPEYIFLMVGISPIDRWPTSVSVDYDAVLSTVSLLDASGVTAQEADPTEESTEAVIPQTSTPVQAQVPNQSGASTSGTPASPNQLAATQPAPTSSQWRIFSNTNYANDLTFFDNLIWVATDGGVVAWNRDGGAAAKFTTQNGLALNVSTSAEACPLPGLGLLIGTNQGLQILNIQEGSWIPLNSANSLMSFDDVVALHCDAVNQFLVIGYERHGLDIYDAAANTWNRVDQSSGLTSNLVGNVAVVGNRREIWIASSFGVNVLENVRSANNQRSTFYSPQNSPLTNERVNDIAVSMGQPGQNQDTTVWMIEDHNLFKVQAGEQSVVGSTQRDWWMYNKENVRSNQFPLGRLVSLDIAPNGDVWLGSEEGELCRFDPVSEKCIDFTLLQPDDDASANNGSLNQVRVSEDGTVYITTSGSGHFQYQAGQLEQFILNDEMLKGNHVNAIAQDSTGVLWIANDFGLQQVNLDDLARGESFISNSAERFRQINSNVLGDELLGDNIRVIASDGDGGMWLGANGAGYFDGTTWSIYKKSDQGLIGSPVQAIAVDALGRTWFGTPSGLSILNVDDFFNLTKAQGLPTDNILSLLADNQDNRNIVWIGTNGGGLLRFEDNQLRIFNRENAGMPSNSITALANDIDGTVLVGTTRGLARFDGEQATPIRSIGNVRITAIATHAKNAEAGIANGSASEEIWVGTEKDGIFFYNGFAWEQLAATDSLPSRQISSILIDRSGAVWIGGTNGGIARYTPEP